MLLELDLKDFVLIRHAAFSFPRGLSVLTGETGAGKSLLVQAIKLLLGAKVRPGHVRPGAEQAVVQGVFQPGPRTLSLLDEMGIEAGEEMIVRRLLPASGRGRTYVNGTIVSIQDLKRLTGDLVSITGQHDFQSLLKKVSHREWLDLFCRAGERASRVRELHGRFRLLERRRDELANKKSLAEGQAKELREQAQRIDSLAPRQGEDEELEQRIRVLKSAQALQDLGSSCYQALYAGRGSVDELLHRSRQDLERMARLDPALSGLLEELEGVIYRAQEISFALRDYLGGLDLDPSRLNEMEERLYELRRLMRAFGPGIPDVLAYRREIEQRLEGLEDLEGDLAALEEEAGRVAGTLLEHAVRLSRERMEGAALLSRRVEEELRALGMEHSRFVVSVSSPPEPRLEDVKPWGLDEVEFLFTPNPGQPARPLSAIASGGELSRVMLALRAVLAQKAPVETLVFDEIDAGIGGEVANQVAERLRRLAARAQVIAITHFPQIASRADHHLLVGKTVSGGETLTEVRPLQGDGRLEELARMLGGNGEAAREFARRLLGAGTER